MIADSAGNLFGTTAGGGSANCANGGCGTVFKLAPDGTETVLYAFKGGSDGANPDSGLIADSTGNLYGTTTARGTSDRGTVFKIVTGGTEAVLHSFEGSDGWEPLGSLIADKKGNLYGTTALGGNMVDCNGQGCGTVFKVKPDGAETVLYAFQGRSDGANPAAGLLADASGNFYGTAEGGGVFTCVNGATGCGVVYKLAMDGTEPVLYAFKGGNDGYTPEAQLIADSAGNLYGTTAFGGGATACGGGCGTVFRVASDGTETLLYALQGGNDGAIPEAGLIADKAGNLYGTTYFGGGSGCRIFGNTGCGVVFQLAPGGKETILFAFHSQRGRNPAAALLAGKNGSLFGTTTRGGLDNDGVVFSVKR